MKKKANFWAEKKFLKMPKFPTEFSSRASKYIKKLEKRIRFRVEDKIKNLEENPFPKEVERVQSYKGEKIFRVRIGNQRILYIVKYNPNKIIIAKVDKRERAY